MTFGHPANSGFTVDVNPATALQRNAAWNRAGVALRYPGADLTYADLEDKVCRLTAVLIEGGVGSGDRVAYVGLNSPAFLTALFAAFRIGAIFVPVNFRLAGPELQTVLERSGAVALIAEPGHRAVVDTIRDSVPAKRFLLVDDDPAVPIIGEATHGWEPWSSLLAEATQSDQIAGGRFDDPALLMFTSGTTGTPKGVVLTYGNIWWNSVNVDTRLDARRGDITYASAPLFHIGALNSFVIRTIVRGGTVVLRRTFDPTEFLADLVQYRVNSTFVVPAMLAALRRVPGVFDTDLSQLRSVVVAAAPVPPSLIREYAEHGIRLQQAWGLTETAPFATHLPAERTLDKLGSAGISMPYTQVRVVDTVSNTPVDAGVIGEIVVRGPNVTPGYWENPDATEAAFDHEGWFHSGDIGYLDDEGYLFIVDRLKDMVISGGENVYPAEVERVLVAMPGIDDVAVVGVPDEKWGEIVVAVVSLDSDTAITLDDVRDFAAPQLARYKLPQRLQIIDRVPRNASGKLEKVTIRSILKEG